VAIEATRGLVVDRLLGAGHPVIPMHPNAFHAVRPRWGAARAKHDPGDSFKLADYARTDIHRLPVLVPTLPETLELQALTRQRDCQLALRITAVSQLAALLDQHWPGGKTIFAQLHSPITLDFLHRYPTPQAAASLTPARIEAFCRRRGYSGRRSAGPSAQRPDIGQSARRARCGADDPWTGRSRACPAGRHRCARHRDRREGHRTPLRGLLADLPGVGTLNLAQIIGEVGPVLERATTTRPFATAHLRRGQKCPMSTQSGTVASNRQRHRRPPRS
jgi:hypothetical protein